VTFKNTDNDARRKLIIEYVSACGSEPSSSLTHKKVIRRIKSLLWTFMSEHVKEQCRRRNIKMIAIPFGLTPYLQAGDLGEYFVNLRTKSQ
jgi:hypothetical protein